MLQTWSAWKRFPEAASGRAAVPPGPGVYEVRHSMTGRVVAFGHAADIAQAFEELRRYGAVGPFARLFSRQPLRTGRSRIPRLSGRQPRRCAGQRPASDGHAPDGLAPPRGAGRGGPPDRLTSPITTERAAGPSAGRFAFGQVAFASGPDRIKSAKAASGECHAERGAERSHHPHRAGHAGRRADAALLAAGGAGRRTCRQPAGQAGAAARRGPGDLQGRARAATA